MASDPLIGRVLGKCRLEARLGQGGMARVYAARHESLDKRVAVKVLVEALSADADFVTRFVREAKSAARLDHPNVIQVLDAGSDGDVHFIVMQFVDGEDVASILHKRGKLSVRDALRIARAVAAALEAAHARGIVHRDIKPSNVMLTKAGRVLVADFGLARETASGNTVTRPDTVLGTPQYMSPEQAEGKAIDARSDLYSLGATLYHFLAGKPPYDGTAPLSIMMKVVKPDEKPPPLRSVNPDVSAEVERFVETLMAKDPGKRPATAKEVGQAIDRLLKGGAEALTPTVPMAAAKSTAPPPRTGARRWLPLAVGAGAVLVVLILVLFLAFRGPSQAERAFRGAERAEQAAGEDPAKLREARDLYERVSPLAPGSNWETLARGRIEALGGQIKKLELQTRLTEARAAYDAGTADFATTLRALKEAGGEAAGTGLEERFAAELESLHRDRLHHLATHLFASLQAQDFDAVIARIDPEKVREVGERGLRSVMELMAGAVERAHQRIEFAVPGPEAVQLDAAAGTAVIPIAVTITRERREEAEHKDETSNWVLREDDWYMRPPEHPPGPGGDRPGPGPDRPGPERPRPPR